MAPCHDPDLASANDNDSRQATNVACRVFLWLEKGGFLIFSQPGVPQLMLGCRQNPLNLHPPDCLPGRVAFLALEKTAVFFKIY